MKLGVVTPSRGLERIAFLEQAERLFRKQQYQAHGRYVINHAPKDENPDMVERILRGVQYASRDGITHLAIWEDDDYYRDDYLANMAAQLTDDTDIMGSNYTPTYHLGLRRWGLEQAHTISVSLHRTVGSVRFLGWALQQMAKDKQAVTSTRLDHVLWHTATQVGAKARVVSTELFDCVAMKHGIGKFGSSYHLNRTDVYPYTDADMYWLKKFTGDDFRFYEAQSNYIRDVREEVI